MRKELRKRRTFWTLYVKVTYLFFCVFCGIVFSFDYSGYKEFKVFVESCYDGDTCRVIFDTLEPPFNSQKVRFLGIDTPEIRAKCKEEKELAIEARDFVRKKLVGKKVSALVPMKGDYKGRYGRVLVRFVIDGVDLSEELLEKGLARRYKGRRANFCE